jgi:hypothetical protein
MPSWIEVYLVDAQGELFGSPLCQHHHQSISPQKDKSNSILVLFQMILKKKIINYVPLYTL